MFIFCLTGTVISVLMRVELYSSGNRIIAPENQNFYNVSITMHGLLMIFFLVMPGLFGGFGNYFVPIFNGSPEVVYPRINNLSIILLVLSYVLIIYLLVPSMVQVQAGQSILHYPLLQCLYRLLVLLT